MMTKTFIAEGVKTPWYKYYDGVKEHLEYPVCTIFDMLESTSKKYPDNVSYNYFGNKQSFTKFVRDIESTASAFAAAGIKKGDVITICMPNTPEGIMAFYAANRIGAIANMVHPLSAVNEIKKYVNDTKSRIIVVVDLAVGKIEQILSDSTLEKVVYVSPSDSMPALMKAGYKLTKQKKITAEKDVYTGWKKFIAGGANTPAPRVSIEEFGEGGDNTAVILYSGGTSGIPKGIALTNMNFNALAMQGVEACACIGEGDKVLAVMPIFHGFGLGICIHTVQYMGGCSVLLPTFSAATFDSLLKKYRPNIVAGVPSLYEAMLRNRNFDGVDLSFLKCVISGGDSLSVGLKNKIDDFLHAHGANIQVREGYGLTECVTGSCMMPQNTYREGSIGIPYPDVYYKIVKVGTDEELPYGEEGEIVLCGPTVMKEYLYHPEETADTLKKHSDGQLWLHTGDLGSMDEDGFIYFKQRYKRVIMSSGYCVYPQYIENVLDSHPAVLMSCVVGVPHPLKLEVAKAFIVLREGYEANDEMMKSLRKLCEENLVKYSWPSDYEFRSELPKTLVGKVAYTVLQAEEAEKAKQNR